MLYSTLGWKNAAISCLEIQLPRIWSLPRALCILPIFRCGWNLGLQNLLLSFSSLEICSSTATHSNLQILHSLIRELDLKHPPQKAHRIRFLPNATASGAGRVRVWGGGGVGVGVGVERSLSAIKHQQLLQRNRRSLPEKMMQTPRSYLQPNNLSGLYSGAA